MSLKKDKIYTLKDLEILPNKILRVGILGGSFNPAHNGHLQITLEALNHFRLDYVIWLVALQNPFKPPYLNDIFARARNALKIAQDSRILVSTAEYDLNTSCNYQIIKYFTNRFDNINFFWLMGADCLEHFHLWENCELIAKLCQIIVFDRPKYSHLFGENKFFANFGLKDNIILHKGPMLDVSSTQIRMDND